MSTYEIIIQGFSILILIALSAFFSGTETAMTRCSRARIIQWDKNGNKNAHRVIDLLNRSEELISSLLTANNFINILSSVIATNLFVKLYGDAGVIITTVIMTIIVVIFAEVIPKIYALANADKIAVIVAPFIFYIVKLLKPVNVAINFIVTFFSKTSDTQKTEKNMDGQEEELRGAIELHVGEDPDFKEEREMLRSVMELDDTSVEEAMTHRKVTTKLDLQQPIEQIIDTVLLSPYSYFPITNGEENIIGVIHHKKIMSAYRNSQKNNTEFNISFCIDKPTFVFENTSLLDQLQVFRDTGRYLGIVVDEYGTFMGVITISDVLEHIVGDISDNKKYRKKRRQLGDGFLVSGDELIRNINREFEWDISDEHASTIAGFVIHESRILPDEGKTFIFHGYKFTIKKRHLQQITKIHVVKLKENKQPTTGN